MLMISVPVRIDQIYVPRALRAALDPEKVRRLAEQILENGQQTPIQLRHDDDRYVLVTGLHRLEAMRALGEETIDSLIVRTRRW
jgi:ParB-like chromosome segregation protein Spo0J